MSNHKDISMNYLYIQTLLNALGISRKIDLTLRDGLQWNDWKISWVIAGNLFRQKSEGRKSDWVGFKSLTFKRKL